MDPPSAVHQLKEVDFALFIVGFVAEMVLPDGVNCGVGRAACIIEVSGGVHVDVERVRLATRAFNRTPNPVT